MEYCLIEKWHPEYSLPQDSRAVALTPEASYWLDRCGIKYTIIEDYYSPEKILQDVELYLDSQLLWFKEFDQFVQDIFPEAKTKNICLPSLYFINLKYSVDTVVLTVRYINEFLDATNPSKVWFLPQIYDDYGGDRMMRQWWCFYFGESHLFRLMELVCRQRGICFEQLFFKEQQNLDSIFNPRQILIKTIYDFADLKKLIYKTAPSWLWNEAKFIHELYYQGRCVFAKPFFSRHKKGNILILKGKNYVYGFCKDAHRYGFKLFFKESNRVFSPYLLPWIKRIKFDRTDGIKFNDGLNRDIIMNELIHARIMKWINEQCGLDVSSILQLEFEYFLCELFPETLSRIKWFINFYNENKIDFVLTYSLSSIDDFSAIAAAKVSRHTKSVAFFHGIDAFDFKARFFAENIHFDLYFASTAGEVKHTKNLAALYNKSHIYVNEYPYYRNRFSSLATVKKKKNVFSKGDRPVVLFLPISRISRPPGLIKGEQLFAMVYLKWHYALIDYFASRPDYYFVWKAYLQPFDRGDTIYQLLKDRKVKNISFSSTSLDKWIPIADRALFDIPSTAFFECIFAGLPVCALYRPESQKLRENAYQAFGQSLQPYSTVDEGLKIVEKFLSSDSAKYIVSIRQSDVSIPDILRVNLSENKKGEE